MRFILRLFEMKTSSVEALKLDDAGRLLELRSRLGGLTAVESVKWFGHTDRLKPIESVDQLVKEFGKRKVETYSFADVKNLAAEEPRRHWTVGVRKVLLMTYGDCEAERDAAITLANELLTLNEILLSFVEGGEVGIPFSFLEVPGVSFRPTRPPRFFKRISKNSVVDVVHLNASYEPQEQEIVKRLREADPAAGAAREFRGDLLKVTWGDLAREPFETILSRRYAWYAEHGDFPLDSSFNALGDEEFALWDAKPTQELTGYSSFNQKGMKAVVFDEPDEVADILEELRRILEAGQTREGHPVREITLVVPTREAAVELRPLAGRHGMRVVYVGDDNKLWNPFPPEYDIP